MECITLAIININYLFYSISLLGQEANERAMDPINACGGVWVPFLDPAEQVIRRYQGS